MVFSHCTCHVSSLSSAYPLTLVFIGYLGEGQAWLTCPGFKTNIDVNSHSCRTRIQGACFTSHPWLSRIRLAEALCDLPVFSVVQYRRRTPNFVHCAVYLRLSYLQVSETSTRLSAFSFWPVTSNSSASIPPVWWTRKYNTAGVDVCRFCAFLSNENTQLTPLEHSVAKWAPATRVSGMSEQGEGPMQSENPKACVVLVARFGRLPVAYDKRKGDIVITRGSGSGCASAPPGFNLESVKLI
ncbi:hypothetical protein FB45DRAFT_1005507 [Roridomyces roridus]|uniref:Uncharacterized protein n=1 Tax=Roridomyces roridus TaxID=1738132 RepID=A0AAD7BLI8_9AGAR|nr:hypothetical protein FB45DRAFT_1005507 [Roridomyces roridus]